MFTWTCAISIAAAARGWLAHEPVTLPNWDLLKDDDYQAALNYIDRIEPHLLVLAWPCTVWSQLQELGRQTPLRRHRLRLARTRQRKLLRFVRDAALRQRRRGGAILGENPYTSRAWKEPLIIEAFDNLPEDYTDMCQFGLCVPGQPLLRKRTRLRGTKEVIKTCCKRCPGNHQHAHVLGGARINGKWINVSDFAGGYTTKFANAVLDGAEEYLRNGRRQEAFVEGGEVEEERFIDNVEEEEVEDEGEEDGEESGEQTLRPRKGSTLWKIKMLHQRLGHPTNDTLVRMLSLSGASPETVQTAKVYECPVCQETSAPGRYLKQRPDLKPVIFGKVLHCDLKYLHDYKGKLFVALSVIDAATSFHVAVLLRSRSAPHVARKFARHWCSIHGIPDTIVLDQGGEFDGEFVGWLETHGIHSKSTGAKSPWQHGFAERHGALLGTMCSSLIWQYQAQGASQVKDCLASAVYAKNATITKRGYTPFQLAFGRSPMFPDLLEEDAFGNLSLRHQLGTEGEVARMAEMRAAARAVLLRQDTQEKIKRALKRWPRGEQKEFEVGEMVFFYSPKPQSARFRKDGGAWRGPAVVIMKESHQRYYLSWRGRCILVSTPNMRSASQAEAAAAEEKVEELKGAEEGWQENKEYEDLSEVTPPKTEEPREDDMGWVPQEGVMRQKKGGLKKNQAKEIAKALRGTKTVIKALRKKKVSARDQEDRKISTTSKQVAKAKETEVEKQEESEAERVAEEKVPELEEKEAAIWKMLEEAKLKDEEKYAQNLKKNLLDDFPMALRPKRPLEVPMEEDQLRKRFKSEVFNYTMAATSLPPLTRANEWASRSEVKKLSTLLDLPLVSVRYHHQPRKRFQKPYGDHPKARITILLSDEAGTALVTQESFEDVEKHPRKKCSHPWRGATLFLREEEGSKREKRVFVELPSGVYSVKVSDEHLWQSMKEREESDRAYFEAFILQMKANGKELDPKHFNEEERVAFKEADRKEWQSWIKNKVVKRLSDEEARKVDRRLIFRAPARLVRVNKGAMEGVLKAKSRMVIPGHLDPHLGSYRADAPTTTWSAVQLAKNIASMRGWVASCFDVTTAFLSGKEVDREVYIRAPCDGLPEIEELNEKAVSPNELLKVCKSAYGLSEAPRLWYLRASEILREIGWEELSMCRATYVLRHSSQVTAILCLHVDDGLVVASAQTMKWIKTQVNQKFSIKEWQDINDQPVTFLGVKTRYVDGAFYDDMTDYVSKIEYASVKGPLEQELAGSDLSAFRRLVMQLRWPAHLVMPEYLFATSDLAQRVSKCTFADLKHANNVLKQMKESAEKGEATLSIKPLKGSPMFISFFDASLGKSSNRAQQGEVHFLSTTLALQQETVANMIEFHSNKVPRVVRSSLAAEGSAMATAGDRMLYNRVLFDALYHGKLEIGSNWRRELGTPGCLVTDAKGLHDHVHKTGGIATEKQSALDILIIKQLVEDEILGLKWTPTWKQLADPLTKEMSGELLQRFRKKTVLCLIQTPADVLEEERRSGIRKAQRERRKARMKLL